MDEDTPASPGEVWERGEARLGRPANGLERAMLRLAAVRDARFVEREPVDFGLDVPVPPDCGVEGEAGEGIGPEAWKRHRAA